jgi:hypothetical protein
VRLRLAGSGLFGLVYGTALALVVVPTWMMVFAIVPDLVGLPARITPPPSLTVALEGRLVLTVRCGEGKPVYELNSRPLTEAGLRGRLRDELSRRAHRVLYIKGDVSCQVGDVVHMISVARDVWFGLPIVLLTPKLEAAPAPPAPDTEPRP